jgi:hypothetical protein
MIGTRHRRDRQLAAQEGRAQFGDEFFHRIGAIAKALVHIAVQAVGRAGPVREFMKQHGVIVFGAP